MYFDILMLRVLADEPQHGYEIKKRVERILGGRSINNNVLYPALRRFGGRAGVDWGDDGFRRRDALEVLDLRGRADLGGVDPLVSQVERGALPGDQLPLLDEDILNLPVGRAAVPLGAAAGDEARGDEDQTGDGSPDGSQVTACNHPR